MTRRKRNNNRKLMVTFYLYLNLYKVSRWQIGDIFFIIIPENRLWHFMQIYLKCQAYFLEKIRKKFQNVIWNFAQSAKYCAILPWERHDWFKVSAQLICKSYSHFFSKNTSELDIVLTRTVNILTTNKLIKLTMLWTSGPSCSKLTMSLVNDSLKFTSSDTQICWNFLLKKCQ